MNLSIEPTTACNLRCPECPSGLRSFTRPTGRISEALYEQLIDQVAAHTLYLTLYFQGEPYLHPHFTHLVQYASRKGIYTATSTNAHFLNSKRAEATVRSGLSRLIISIDGVTQQTYEAYRREGKLEKVLEGAKNIIYWKKKLKSSTPHVIFQFLVVKPNEHEIPELHQLAKAIGADEVQLKTAQIYDYKNGSPLIPENTRYSRYKQLPNGKWVIKNNLLNQCWKMWAGCVITWDGKVVPCCFDKDASHTVGNLTTESFHEVWNSEAYQRFRAQLLTGRSQIEMCKNCTEGTKVFG